MSEKRLFGVGLLLVWVTAYCSVGYHHPDEHFQILEFANWFVGRTPVGDLPWEFEAQIRPALQPLLAFVQIKALNFMGMSNPFIQALWFRILSGTLAFFIYYQFIKNIKNEYFSRDFAWILLVFLWFMPYQMVRFTSENWGGFTFWAGIFFARYHPQKKLLMAGFLLGLSFVFRFQMGFALAGLGGWLLFHRYFNLWQCGSLISGGLLAIGIGTIADRIFYGAWVFTPYQYFFANILENKAANWGIMPWWWYFTEFLIQAIPPVSVALVVLLLKGAHQWRHHVIVWVMAAFVIGHSMVGHKEMRFLFPMSFGLLLLCALGWSYWSAQWRAKKAFKPALLILVVLNSIVLLVRCILPAHDFAGIQSSIYQTAKEHDISTLIYVEKDPYEVVGLNTNFYKYQPMSVTPMDAISESMVLPSNTLICTKKPMNNPHGTLVYQTIPDWLRWFNINNWQSRTNQVFLYRIE